MTKTTGKKIRGILKGIVAFLIVTMSLFHVFYESYSPEIKNNNQTYKKTIKTRNSLQKKHLEDLRSGKVSVEEYYTLSTKLLSDSKKSIRSINNEKRAINKEHSFRGRNSFRFWIFAFGLVSALLFFSCKSLYDDIVHGSTFRFQFLSLAGITISFFWMIHLIFYTQKDFNNNSYIAIILFCAALSAAFTYFLVKYYTYKDDIILKQISLIERIKTIHYPRVALKALYSERNDRAMLATDRVKDNANAFDKDILTILEDV